MGRPRICCARAAQDHAAPPALSEKAATRRRSIACPRASRWSPPKYGEWREGTAEALPFPDRSFDVAVSQFGLMFFTDRDKAIHEMLRVMAAGGRCVVAVWDAIENAPPFAVLVGLLDRIAGKAAGDALRAPFVLGDRRALAALFSGAGASSVDITTRQGTARFRSTRELVEADPGLAARDGGCSAGARDQPHRRRGGEGSRPLRHSRWRNRVQHVGASRQLEEALAGPTSRSDAGLTQQRRSFRYLLAKWSRRMAVMQAFVRIIPNSQTATRTCKRHDLRRMQAILLPSTGAQLPQRGDTRELKRTHQSALESLLAKNDARRSIYSLR
jgi:hypothetical protein